MSQNVTGYTLALSGLALLAAYLAGSIPFGYLIPYWTKGIDIRTVGSGNPGATNVGRVLGARYFVVVMALDLAKGLVPILALPALVQSAMGSRPVDLPVGLALAAILGHTYPIFLKFRGGKGVATSLGAVLALDPVSCGVAVVAFAVVFWVTHYVSLSSLTGGLAFVDAHFLRDNTPLSREHIAMSLFSTAVLALLVVRHRANLARLWMGSEARIQFGKSRALPELSAQRSGRIGLVVLAGLFVLSLVAIGGTWLIRQARTPIVASAGLWSLRETDRVATGLQRIDSVAFDAHGTRLAATCPRYGRLALYQVELQGKLSLLREVDLEGRPVGLAAIGDRIIALVSPANDQRHVEAGWWQCFDFEGNAIGGRNVAGYYPDDVAATPDGKHLLVLTSGRAEGDDKKPFPGLDVVALNNDCSPVRIVGHVTFEVRDDPVRIALSASGNCAAVLLAKTNETLALDLASVQAPRVISRIKPTAAEVPYLSASTDREWIIMPVASQAEALAIKPPLAGTSVALGPAQSEPSKPEYLLCTRQRESVLELVKTTPLQTLGQIPLKGPFNLGRTRPSGLAYSPERGLAAVATRTGTIHVIELAPRSPSSTPSSLTDEVATAPSDKVRR
jgi:acyl-phosphate glycerol 3-phosphate acyltransferase